MNNKERVYYVKDTSTGELNYLGKCVSYGAVNAYGKSLEELEKNIREQLSMEKDYIDDILSTPDSLDMVEVATGDAWLWTDVNTTYWEIERLKYLLKSDEKFRKNIEILILGTLLTTEIGDTVEEQTSRIINTIIEHENK